MSSPSSQPSVVPAQLASLAIYNPAFGDSDETAYEQIFYYYSRKDHERKEDSLTNTDGRDAGAQKQPSSEEAERNERLRQVGLARGMVEFAK